MPNAGDCLFLHGVPRGFPEFVDLVGNETVDSREKISRETQRTQKLVYTSELYTCGLVAVFYVIEWLFLLGKRPWKYEFSSIYVSSCL